MTKKKIPLRTCIVTKEKLPKEQLVRIVRTSDGLIEIDETGKRNGRGAYIKLETRTLAKMQKTKQLERHLRAPIPHSVYETLERLCIDGASTDT
jgi:hypothetical protein